MTSEPSLGHHVINRHGIEAMAIEQAAGALKN
jgi:hypothetical protein